MKPLVLALKPTAAAEFFAAVIWNGTMLHLMNKKGWSQDMAAAWCRNMWEN